MKQDVIYNDQLLNWKRKTGVYISSQLITLFGTSLVDYAIIWYITLQTKSAILMSVSMICVFLPKIFISFFAGIWADRFNKKRLVILSDMIIALVTLIFGVLFYLGYNDLWLIFLILIIRSLGTGTQTPASMAIIPDIVPEKFLLRINGLNSSLNSVIAILSPAVGGLILSYYTLEYIAFIDVFTAIIGISFLSTISLQDRKEKSGKGSYFKEYVESFVYLRKNVILKKIFSLYSVLFFLAIPLTLLTPLKITRTFGDDVWRLSLNEVMFSIGSILGGIIIAMINKERNNYMMMLFISFLSIGIACFFLSLTSFIVILASFFVIGLFISFSNSTTMTVLQKNIGSNYLGRIFSLVQILASAINLIGLVIFGYLGDNISIDYIFIFISISFVAYSIYIKINNGSNGQS